MSSSAPSKPLVRVERYRTGKVPSYAVHPSQHPPPNLIPPSATLIDVSSSSSSSSSSLPSTRTSQPNDQTEATAVDRRLARLSKFVTHHHDGQVVRPKHYQGAQIIVEDEEEGEGEGEGVESRDGQLSKSKKYSFSTSNGPRLPPTNKILISSIGQGHERDPLYLLKNGEMGEDMELDEEDQAARQQHRKENALAKEKLVIKMQTIAPLDGEMIDERHDLTRDQFGDSWAAKDSSHVELKATSILEQVVQQVGGGEEDPEEKGDDDDDDDDDDEEEEEEIEELIRPTFISKDERETLPIREQRLLDHEAEAQEKEEADKLARLHALAFVQRQELELERENRNTELEDVDVSDIEDNDDLEAEYELWKEREFKRLERDRMKYTNGLSSTNHANKPDIIASKVESQPESQKQSRLDHAARNSLPHRYYSTGAFYQDDLSQISSDHDWLAPTGRDKWHNPTQQSYLLEKTRSKTRSIYKEDTSNPAQNPWIQATKYKSIVHSNQKGDRNESR